MHRIFHFLRQSYGILLFVLPSGSWQAPRLVILTLEIVRMLYMLEITPKVCVGGETDANSKITSR